MPKGLHRPKVECHPDRPHYGHGMCFNCYRRDYYAKNPKWNAKVKKRATDYAQANPEKVRVQKAEYYEKNGAKLRAKAKQNYRENRDAIRHRKKLSLVGITNDQYDRMIIEHNGVCGICRKTNNGRPLIIDHCHRTKVVRGLLCSKCNVGIGLLQDSSDVVESALSYLRKTQPAQEKIFYGQFRTRPLSV